MDRFTTMATFVEVVKRASFTTAARSRGISRALVSRHIADLEAHLGVSLLTRTTRSLNLTESGREYYQLCSRILSEIGTQEQLISGRNREVEGPLAIIAPKWIGDLDLADAVTDFCKTHPRLTAAPSYLDRHRQPSSPKALAEHNCLVQPNDPIWTFGKGKATSKIKIPKSFS